MRQKPETSKDAADKLVKNIRSKTRQTYSAEGKIRIVLAGLRGEESISVLCRREGTSHQIRRMADHLLPENVRDVDGEVDDRKGTVSVFDGVEPVVVIAPTWEAEKDAAAAFLQDLISQGILPGEIGIFCRSNEQISRAAEIAAIAELRTVSSLSGPNTGDAVLIGTMHLAKGLEFRAVLIVGCDEGVLPLQSRIADVADEFELDEVVSTEKQLLYVAATRAREPCSPPKSNRKTETPFDRTLYKSRHKIENMFGKLKDWRRIHTRYDRCAHAFMSAIAIAETVIFWINQ